MAVSISVPYSGLITKLLPLQESKPAYVRLPEGEKEVYQKYGPSEFQKALSDCYIVDYGLTLPPYARKS